jgi:hypothetical protein
MRLLPLKSSFFPGIQFTEKEKAVKEEISDRLF